MDGPWQHRTGDIQGLRFHWVEAGTGPLVVLLHGFPEFWYCWRWQIPALAAAGFRVVAPDLRGCNESARPAGIRHYRMEMLVGDVAGLIRHLGAARAAVVGHDWGGAISWRLAMTHPELVERLAILNAPHPAAFLRELRRPRQALRSWYIRFFQLPLLPEWCLRFGDFAWLERLLTRQPLRAGAYTPEDLRRYKEALAMPGALTAALHYYRAALRDRQRAGRGLRPIACPTLVIWGERDPYLGVELTQGLEEWVPQLRIERLHASHWVQNDAVEEVNRLLASFLGSRN
jgi:pimeloyl-ACP methyl ester carboxylesterase